MFLMIVVMNDEPSVATGDAICYAAGPKISGHKNKVAGNKELKFLIRYKSLISSASLDWKFLDSCHDDGA